MKGKKLPQKKNLIVENRTWTADKTPSEGTDPKSLKRILGELNL